MILVPRLVSNP